jgi:glucose/arabinose dehydrogenase
MRKTTRSLGYLCAGMAALAISGCYSILSSEGGGQTDFSPPRRVDPSDVALPQGYKLSVVSTGFTFPTGVTFDEAGNPYVVEAGYSYGEVFTVPRLLKVNPDGSHQEVFRGQRNGPWTGAAYANGKFYIAEGGELEGGRILSVTPDGAAKVLVGNLPSLGDHHTNGIAIGPDGKIYFGQGTVTNSAVVGVDNAKFGWLKRYPQFHDTPCKDVTLTGANFETQNVFKPGTDERVVTGAYSPYGVATTPGQVIRGRLPCNGAVMRVNPDGSKPELVAWGFRNPYGLAFSPDGELYLTENGYDVRGSRPVWGAADVLWQVTPGAWYGWPDFSAGQALDGENFKPPGKPLPPRLLQEYPATPPRPVASLGVHASANGLDFSRSDEFGYVGQAFIAEFGDMAPAVGKVLHPVGFRVVRVDPSNGWIQHFAVNKGKHNGPASKLGSNGFERPVSVRFNPAGDALYVVDFGVLTMGPNGAQPRPGTGVLWKITR